MFIDDICVNNLDPNEELNKRRNKAFKERNDAKWAALTDYLNFPVYDTNRFQNGQQILSENDEIRTKIEHEIMYVLYGEEYAVLLEQQDQLLQEEAIYKKNMELYVLAEKKVSPSVFVQANYKRELLIRYNPHRYGKGGTYFKNSKNKDLYQVKDVAIGNLFKAVINKIKEKYKLY